LWVYGHQSPTSEHNCKDIEAMVGFDAVGANRGQVLNKAQSVNARGYTPLTDSIRLAAADVGKEPGARAVVLVSDGKETCAGDPCAAAKALADADAKLVIHTIGFNVDAAARYQLQCIARVARGTYSDATGAGDLASKLGAVAEVKPPATKSTLVVTTPKPGRLQMKPIFGVHNVVDAVSGKQVKGLTGSGPTVELPAGIYNVAFGGRMWKSVEVRPGELTVIEPGVLEIKNASISGHQVLDEETGEQVANYASSMPFMELIPSTYTVTFGKALWPVEIKPGERKVLNPGIISVRGMGPTGLKVKTEGGSDVGTIVSSSPRAAFPPGKYTLEVGDQRVPIELSEGQVFEINLR
jgi:hypothetical protein